MVSKYISIRVLKSAQITITELRARPGEYLLAVTRARQSFVITKHGKPVAKLGPINDDITIESDGTILGELPLTHRLVAGSDGLLSLRERTHP